MNTDRVLRQVGKTLKVESQMASVEEATARVRKIVDAAIEKYGTTEPPDIQPEGSTPIDRILGAS